MAVLTADPPRILVVNCGSSSLKYRLFDGERAGPKGTVERIGEKGSPVATHREAALIAYQALGSPRLDGVGHRVVHGGERFSRSVLIDDSVIEGIRACADLAPLHNPHNLTGYFAMKALAPDAGHVAVFDTAFHTTLAPHAFVYGLPYSYYQTGRIRRYGFHGTSHRYIAGRVAELVPAARRIVNCHLGNGCSVCAIEDGQSVDTSMGLTPLEGLLMGTRAGDLDTSAVLQIMRRDGIEAAEMERVLNHQSGLLGVSGLSNDMRDLLSAEAQGNARAALAIGIFCYRVRKYIGAYAAALGGLDVLTFTAGIGEHAPEVRRRICRDLDFLGIRLDESSNLAARGETRISDDASPVQVWVVPTDEELVIARDTCRCILSK